MRAGVSKLVALAIAGLGACSGPTCSERAPSPRAPQKQASARNPAAAPAGQPAAPEEVQLIDRIRELGSGAGVRYAAPSPAEEASFRAWVRAALAAAPSNEPPQLAPPQGFALEASTSGRWLLRELARHQRGAGLVVLRTGPSQPWIIEAPHTRFEAGTLELAVSCFELFSARALLVDTMRRTQSEDRDLDLDDRRELARSGRAESDLAHAEHSFFLAAHTEMIAADPGLSTLQLHGYRDERATEVSVVISAAGSRARIGPAAAELAALFGPAVRRYPDQIRDLGGTTNVQAGASRSAGSGFVHIELSRSARERLRTDAGLRAEFARRLKAGLAPRAGERERADPPDEGTR
jgi:hypothetical protein